MKDELVICDECGEEVLLSECEVISGIGPGAHHYVTYICADHLDEEDEE